MSNRDTRAKILEMSKDGIFAREIADRLGVSKQWVHYVRKQPQPKRPERRGRKPAPLDHLIPGTPKRRFKPEQIPQVHAVLTSRDSWTWQEADKELRDQGLFPPGSRIVSFLRDCGFQYERLMKRWIKK